MSSDIATSIPREDVPQGVGRRSWRVVVVQLLGPLTMVGALVWAVAQPYRVIVLDRAGQGPWDYLFQPPLLVLLVGALFTFAIAPGLVEDVEELERDGSAA